MAIATRRMQKNRVDDGIIVGLVDQDGRHWSLWEPPITVDGRDSQPPLRRVVALCRQNGWKIRVISTPVTIMRDLDGSRSQPAGRVRREMGGTQINLPEPMLLGLIDALDVYAKGGEAN